jgi:diacylglycerol kinase (ATP)
VSIELRIATAGKNGAVHAREGVAAGCDAVIAAGGDGTVNAVLNGLAGGSTPLGIFPMGTANDFANQTGIPGGALEALTLILESEPVLIDTGSLNGRHFLNVSTGGVGAETTAETSDELKAVLGPLAYAVTGIRKLSHLDPMRLDITAGDMKLECDALVFAVGNGRTTGGGNVITPRASLVDGLLDVCVVEAMPVASLLPLLLRMRAGDHPGDEGVHYFQSPEVTIVAAAPVTVNIDGEPLEEIRLEYRVERSHVRVHLRHLPGESPATD